MGRNLRKILISRTGARIMAHEVWNECGDFLAQVQSSRPKLVTEPVICTESR